MTSADHSCTCGSGACPRPCATHPWVYREHVAELYAESVRDEQDESQQGCAGADVVMRAKMTTMGWKRAFLRFMATQACIFGGHADGSGCTLNASEDENERCTVCLARVVLSERHLTPGEKARLRPHLNDEPEELRP